LRTKRRNNKRDLKRKLSKLRVELSLIRKFSKMYKEALEMEKKAKIILSHKLKILILRLNKIMKSKSWTLIVHSLIRIQNSSQSTVLTLSWRL